MNRKILVTSALPYANGPIHLGHLVEYIQTDIWARYQRHIGNQCVYICADDTHGTPIMVNAEKEGVTPEAFVLRFSEEHQQDFSEFNIVFDYYGSTHSEDNRMLSEKFFLQAVEKNSICVKDVEQFFDEEREMFLPDRYVYGTCPFCDAKNQYGDSCEKCLKTYSSTEIKNPVSILSNKKPVKKITKNYFFKLSQYTEVIKAWLSEGAVSTEVLKKLNEWLLSGLKDWDISRDPPYFGFPIPGTDGKKYFYVWVDAPICYVSSTQQWQRNKNSLEDIWSDENWEKHHFIGKDVLYFHGLFWPAILKVLNLTLPNRINVHGFLTINGEKMSKSRGTFITARRYLDSKLDVDCLRYYYASKLSGGVQDIDLSLDDFVYKVNSDLLGKFINIGSRLGKILSKTSNGYLGVVPDDGKPLLTLIQSIFPNLLSYYESLNTSKLLLLLMEKVSLVNKYIDESAPWKLIESDQKRAVDICTVGLNAFRLFAIALKPIIPKTVLKIENFLKIDSLVWSDHRYLIENHQIKDYEHIMNRLKLDDVKVTFS